jgi:type IV secretory pathway VirB10-like protein
VIAKGESEVGTQNRDVESAGNGGHHAGGDRSLDGGETTTDSTAGAQPVGTAPGSPTRTPLPSRAQLRAPFPLAKRLNRNALTVASALAGVTVLTVIVLTKPARETAGAINRPIAATGDVAPPIPARPTFLDQPPRISAIGSRSESAVVGRGRVTWPRGREPGDGGVPYSRVPLAPPLSGSVSGSVGSSAANDSVADEGSLSGVSAGAHATRATRMQAYEAALMSSVLVGDAGRDAGVRGVGGPAEVAREVADIGAGGGVGLDTPPPASGLPTTARMPATTRSAPTIVAGAPSISAEVPGGAIGESLASPGSGYALRSGTLIPGLLLTGVNSDLPGAVLGQTSRDVFDSRTEQVLLVPKGSRLMGVYDSRSAGTGRLIVEWTRLILPDGRSLSLPRLAATDERGQAGLHDQVDHHYGRVYGAALLTSILTAGVQLSQPQQSALVAAPSSRQVAAGSLGQSLGDVSLESARRGLEVPPTLTIRPGQPFNVMLSGDVVFDEPYIATTAAAH